MALLALRANSTVPHHQLVEELWEEHPPSSAATTLQTYIYQLRKLPGLGHQPVTGPTGQVPALLTTPGGYRLCVPDDCMDVQEFKSLSVQGRQSMERGAVAEAADALHRALAIWRGPALSDLTPGPVVSIDALRLEEQRYEVLMERIDADLLLGRHDRLISELSALAADNPTREGMHAKLMLALYRAGRRPEALEAFHRLRRLLARELGLEPCAELQRLHQRMLAGDPSLELPRQQTAVRAAPPAPIPAQRVQPPGSPAALPQDVPLVGRESDVEAAVRMLTEPEDADSARRRGPRCVAVAGPPGVGVSAFCAHVAHRLRDAFPDGCLYVSFGDPADPRSVDEVLATLLSVAGIRPSGLPATRADRARLLRAWTAGRRVLLVVDDVTCAQQIADLLPADSGPALLVGGHRRLHGAEFTSSMELAPLGARRSVELIRHELGRDRAMADPSALRELLDLCGGLPGPLLDSVALLALRPHWSMRQLIGWMGRARPEPAAPKRPHPLRSAVRRCSGLEPRLRDALPRLVREADEGITVERAADALGLGFDDAQEVLEELVEWFLLDADLSMGTDTSWFFQYRALPVIRLAQCGAAAVAHSASATAVAGRS